METFDMTPRANPCLKTKPLTEYFNFMGEQCGNCDKADDTTKTNTADLWKLYGAVRKAFSFRSQFDKRKVQKENFNIEN